MARKMMTALALMALCSTAACNSVTGPVDTGKNTQVQRRGDRQPVEFNDPGQITPDPNEGGGSGGSGAGDPLQFKRLPVSHKLPAEINPGPGEDGSGGGDGDSGPGTGITVHHRGAGDVAPPHP